VNEDLAACVTVIDKLTYAGCTNNFTADQKKQINFIHADICNPDALGAALKLEKNTSGVSIIHFAAESHVDRSIEDMSPFIKTNIEGTNTLLLGALRYFESLYSGGERENFRFLHVSTDEVYGALGDTGAFYETTQLQPNSPYSASKASSDHLVRAFYKTYGLPTLTTRCSNNYGPYQFPEKFIPVMILQAVNNKPLPVYGEGKNIRDWIHVDDHSRALYAVLTGGKVGEVYNIGGENERRNIDMAKTMAPGCDIEVVGIRPGEKLHEIMIPETESRNTVEYDDYFVIQPSFQWWDKNAFLENTQGKKLKEGFEYSSDKNHLWLTPQELLKIISKKNN